MKNMKGFTKLIFVLLVAAVLAVSCKKDKEEGTLMFNTPAVFISEPNGTVTVGFSVADINIKTVSVTSKPKGWADPQLDLVRQTITITAPAEIKDDVDKSGSVILSGSSYDGVIASATLFVGVVDTKDLSNKPANSYIVTEKQMHYTFDAMHKGDGVSSLATASVGIVWQSASTLLQYVKLDDGKASFYVGVNDEDKLREGNALVGAYDAGGKLIWSWHVWVANYNPDAEGGNVDLNGYIMMTRNLGALNNANSTTDEILASYGLYYQWGRHEPFIGPNSYQASNGASASMYKGNGGRISMTTIASSAETGTLEYATQNPMTFITGVTESKNNWLWSQSDAIWSADNNVADKSVNDPCPHGWRVAPAAAFENLSIVNTPAEGDEEKFGWTLSDGSLDSFFIGAGRRRYDNGTISNIYNPLPPARSVAMEAQPWEGLYWTTGVDGTQSKALYFWFEKLTTTAGIETSALYARANGMQVRCVKVGSR